MTPGAHLAAAAEILTEIFATKSAADRMLVAWGRARRFAGSKDRAAIAERVYTILRRRNECAFRMNAETSRALVVGSLSLEGLGADAINALCTDGQHALGALTADERRALDTARDLPPGQPWIALNYPKWLHDELSAAFGADLDAELTALNARAPLDLRVNTLKARRDDVMRELDAAGLAPTPCPYAPNGIRLASGDAKVAALAAYAEGRIEIQDEASQLAVALAAARPGHTVIDLAAGGGGKSLALAAQMQNRGRIFACDIEPARLRHMEPRVARAGAKIIEIVGDPYGGAITSAAGTAADIVFVDAPCSSTGTWRRNPETKWTLDAARLASFRAAQAKLLDRAATLAGPATRIVYVVCSVLPSEGGHQIEAFRARSPGWSVSPISQIWNSVLPAPPPGAAQFAELTPARAATDGFFVAVLERNAA